MWTNTNQSSYQPRCFCIDANGDQPQTGLQARWPAFNSGEYNETDRYPAKYCNGVDIGLRRESDPPDIGFWPSAKPERCERNERRVKARRGGGRRVAWTAKQLVISDSVHHSPSRLRGSETSMGPDFVHMTEKRFCDMGIKILYPLCETGSNTTATGCFELENQKLITGSGLESRDAASPYTKVRDWRATA